jgi:hypothetical protein
MVKIDRESSEGLKLAYLFWSSIGRPKAFSKLEVLESWAARMEKLMRMVSLPFWEFRWFIIWCTRLPDANTGAQYGNTWTAENLRIAKNPMGSLEKQFSTTYYEVFLPKSAAKISLLRDAVQQEMDARSVRKPHRGVTYYDVVPVDPEHPLAWETEFARWLTEQDEAFPMLCPARGEDMDDFIDRTFAPYAVFRGWRCRKCEYGVGEDGDVDERVKWCADCWEEIWLDIQDDLEMLMEIPTVSCLGQW